MPVKCNNPLIKKFSDELVDLNNVGPGCRLFEYGLSKFFEKWVFTVYKYLLIL
jgi:hypothetical protein